MTHGEHTNLDRPHLLLLSMTLFCKQRHGSKWKRHRERLRRHCRTDWKARRGSNLLTGGTWQVEPWLNVVPQNPPCRQPSGLGQALT